MKKLITYLEKLATPANTMGIGDPGVMSDGILTEPIYPIEGIAKAKKEKTKKKKKVVKEGIFDIDLAEKEVLLSDMYELSNVSYHNSVTNNINEVIGAFDKNKLKNLAKKCKVKVDSKNGFIEYWSQVNPLITDLITVLLNTPYSVVVDGEADNIEKLIKGDHENSDMFKHYRDIIKKNILTFFTRWYFHVRAEFPQQICITIVCNALHQKPSSIKLTFEKR